MAEFFPRQTVVWKATDESIVRRLTLSIVFMGAVAGVMAHLTDWLLDRYVYPASALWWLILGYTVPWVVMLILATVHLGNYTIRRWTYRAPLFGLVVGIVEKLVSALLVWVGRERLGTSLMTWGQWREDILSFVLLRVLIVGGFTLILAGVVQVIRFALLRRERRESTVIAVHEEHVRLTAEHQAPQPTAPSGGE